MKFLILILIFLNSIAFGSDYMPKVDIGLNTEGKTIYTSKRKCEKVHGDGSCIKIPLGYNAESYEIVGVTQVKEHTES